MLQINAVPLYSALFFVMTGQMKERKKYQEDTSNCNNCNPENDQIRINVNKKIFSWNDLYQKLHQRPVKLLLSLFLVILFVSACMILLCAFSACLLVNTKF